MATSEFNPSAPSEPSSAQPTNMSAANGANQSRRVAMKHLRSKSTENRRQRVKRVGADSPPHGVKST
jgi:hypothetical protein